MCGGSQQGKAELPESGLAPSKQPGAAGGGLLTQIPMGKLMLTPHPGQRGSSGAYERRAGDTQAPCGSRPEYICVGDLFPCDTGYLWFSPWDMELMSDTTGEA